MDLSLDGKELVEKSIEKSVVLKTKQATLGLPKSIHSQHCGNPSLFNCHEPICGTLRHLTLLLHTLLLLISGNLLPSDARRTIGGSWLPRPSPSLTALGGPWLGMARQLRQLRHAQHSGMPLMPHPIWVTGG